MRSRLFTAGLLMTALLVGACDDDPPKNDAKPAKGNVEADETGGEDGPAPSLTAAKPAGEVKAKLGFDVKKHGFAFENYANEGGVKNLGAEEMEYLFGDEVCAGHADDACLLTPSGRQWLEQVNEAMSGGHCEGMAVLSLLMFAGEVELEPFGPEGKAPEGAGELAFEGNRPLQREVALWWATQATSPTQDAEKRDLTPSQVVDALTKAMKAGKGGELFSVGIYKEDMSGGHAITPIAIREADGGQAQIVVYDNNYPGIERIISVDRGKNTWSYLASTNPSEPDSAYVGGAKTGNLTLTPMKPRMQKQACPFCGEVELDGEDFDAKAKRGTGKFAAKGSKVQTAEIWLDGAADLLLTDEAGKRLGMANGKLITEMPGGHAVAMRTGDLWHDEQEPMYLVPLGKSVIEATLDGSRLKKEADSEVTLIAPGFTLEVDGILLRPGQKDHITFSKDLQLLVYETDADETPELLIGVSRPGADFEFIVTAGGDSDGHEVMLGIDLKRSMLVVGVQGRDGASEFDLEMTRIDDDGEDVFVHEGNAAPAGSLIYIDFGKWGGNGQPVAVQIDEDGDGKFDKEESFDDAN